jgi:hypothetical protein
LDGFRVFNFQVKTGEMAAPTDEGKVEEMNNPKATATRRIRLNFITVPLSKN